MVKDTTSIIHSLIRYPFLLFVGLILIIDLCIYFFVRMIVYFYEKSVVQGKLKHLLLLLAEADSYDEYCKIANLLDEYLQANQWKLHEHTKLYDYQLIKEVTINLQMAMEIEDVVHCREMITRSACKPNLANIDNEELYSRSFIGTKTLIEEYHSTLLDAVKFVYFHIDDKMEFLSKIDDLYGRTALNLSGGAMMCLYHIGLIKTLHENKCLPRVLSGTSGGALFGSVLATWKDEELHEFFEPSFHTRIQPCKESMWTKFMRLYKEGKLYSEVLWIQETREVYGDLTFLEAFERTGRTWNISVVSESGVNKLLNHLQAPDVLIWSAVLASSALPGILNPFTLMMKSTRNAPNRYDINPIDIRPHPNDKREAPNGLYLVPFKGWGNSWRDGSLRMDIPREMNQQLNINFTVVSQVNPHVLPFFYNHKGMAGSPSIHRRGGGWRGGYLLSWWEHVIKLDLRKWLRVTMDLQMLPPLLEVFEQIWLQKFHGNVTITVFIN